MMDYQFGRIQLTVICENFTSGRAALCWSNGDDGNLKEEEGYMRSPEAILRPLRVKL